MPVASDQVAQAKFEKKLDAPENKKSVHKCKPEKLANVPSASEFIWQLSEKNRFFQFHERYGMKISKPLIRLNEQLSQILFKLQILDQGDNHELTQTFKANVLKYLQELYKELLKGG